MEQRASITISDIAIKARSKKEVYNVLTVEGELYLPPIVDTTQKYLKEILTGKKKYLLCKDVKISKVPHTEKLRIRDILAFALKHIEIQSYIPEYEYNKPPHRDWLCNVINSLIPDKFKAFILQALNEKEKMLVMQKRMNVAVLPEFIKIFSKSNSISTCNGRTHFLAREPFRTRKGNEMEVDDKVIEEAKNQIKALEHKISEQEQLIFKQQRTQRILLEDKEKLVRLYEAGYIDSDGKTKYERE